MSSIELRTNTMLPENAAEIPRVRAFTLATLADVLRGYGVEAAPILREAGLPPDAATQDEFAWIPLEKFACVLTLAARKTGDPYFGLKYGSVARFTANPLAYLIANAPNLRTALRSFVQFHKVIASNNLQFVESNGNGRVEWTYPVTVSHVGQLTDFGLMRFIWRIQSAAGGTWRPISVGLTHRCPADAREYERRVGPRIAFDQAINSIVIGGATLSLPMPGADPQLFKLLQRFCAQQLEQQEAAEHPLNLIREAMTRCLQQGDHGPKWVAKELGLTPGVLHRRLKGENTSFQRLLDDTRRCLTRRYLTETSLKLSDIATKVGYSELSAFSRAARRWFGTSPRSFRRRAPNLDAAA
jgi:AraC-like DNA-binding protein